MKILVACEFSGVVRNSFLGKGHHVVSVDLLPTEKPGMHYQRDILDFLYRDTLKWDLMIAFPPCTHLAVSGARWFKDKVKEQEEAIEFFKLLAECPYADKICIENPIGVLSTKYRKPDQIIQPWQFGHGKTKATCLWLKGLPKLTPTNIVSGRFARVHQAPPGPNRWKERSRTYQGIADAMAKQWG